MSKVETIEQLEAIYGEPAAPSLIKVTDYVTPHYAKFIAASPFVSLATCGAEGLDCSPRGGLPGFVRLADERTLMMPDRRGNNRVDSLRNIVRDPRVGLLFMVPGSGSTLRVNGKAHVSIDAELLNSFAVDGKPPRSVIAITTEAVYFQCARAIVRSKLWSDEVRIDPKSLPTPGDVLAALSNGEVGGKSYDDEWWGRANKTLW